MPEASRPAEVVPPASGKAWSVPAGALIRVVDPYGGQTGDVFAVAADDPSDGQSNGRTFDITENLRLTTGSVLYSRRARPLLTITEDEVGTHDFLWAPCTQYGAGSPGPVPRCLENLTEVLGAHGVPATTITTTLNIFMNVAISEAGRLEIIAPVSKPGQGMTFRAERDLIIGITACASASANAGGPQALGVQLTMQP